MEALRGIEKEHPVNPRTLYETGNGYHTAREEQTA